MQGTGEDCMTFATETGCRGIVGYFAWEGGPKASWDDQKLQETAEAALCGHETPPGAMHRQPSQSSGHSSVALFMVSYWSRPRNLYGHGFQPMRGVSNGDTHDHGHAGLLRRGRFFASPISTHQNTWTSFQNGRTRVSTCYCAYRSLFTL